ncbi:MAG: putative flap endonuclease-1-like 5' DNA nuclease [Flavobacteriales bacterium]|jgi:predicted flap endonuclease-1-like 5' DNA nuclease
MIINESLAMTKKTEKKIEKKVEKKTEKKPAKKVTLKKTTAKKATADKKTEKKGTVDKTISVTTLKKIDSKLTSTKEELESQVEGLSAKVKKMGKKSGKKAFKLLKELDENYQKRLANLQTEFEERLASLSTVKNKVLELLPNVLAEKISSNESGTVKSAKPVKVIDKTPVSKPQPKATIKTPTIASIKGIGPVMQKKLAEQGITILEDIADTPESKIETLKQFEKERGFDTWEAQAKLLLANNAIKGSS